jgi:ribosomal protein L40E
MNIAQFNKDLTYKVAKANGLEKIHKFKEAIEIWLDISETALKVSKIANLEFSYKSMLMEKTEQIINHIKDLKLRLSGQMGESIISKQSIASNLEYIDEDEEISKSTSIEKQTPLNKTSNTNNKANIIEESDLKNLPIGFKEIKPSKDFKIVTPHDENYVKEMLNKEVNMDIFKHDTPEEHSPARIDFEQPQDKNKMICFACGTKIPLKSSKCPSCGTELHK